MVEQVVYDTNSSYEFPKTGTIEEVIKTMNAEQTIEEIRPDIVPPLELQIDYTSADALIYNNPVQTVNNPQSTPGDTTGTVIPVTSVTAKKDYTWWWVAAGAALLLLNDD